MGVFYCGIFFGNIFDIVCDFVRIQQNGVYAEGHKEKLEIFNAKLCWRLTEKNAIIIWVESQQLEVFTLSQVSG